MNDVVFTLERGKRTGMGSVPALTSNPRCNRLQDRSPLPALPPFTLAIECAWATQVINSIPEQ